MGTYGWTGPLWAESSRSSLASKQDNRRIVVRVIVLLNTISFLLETHHNISYSRQPLFSFYCILLLVTIAKSISTFCSYSILRNLIPSHAQRGYLPLSCSTCLAFVHAMRCHRTRITHCSRVSCSTSSIHGSHGIPCSASKMRYVLIQHP